MGRRIDYHDDPAAPPEWQGSAGRLRAWQALLAPALAFLLPVSTFVGYLIGYLLDKVFHTHFLYIPFLLLGIAAGFVKLIQQLQRDTRDDG